MKDAIQVVLVDPIEDSRRALQSLFGGISSVWLSEACTAYQGAAKRVAEIAPSLVVVVIDEDPMQAINVIATIVQNCPGVAVLPASRVRDSSVILRVVRAGAREFLTLPTEADELLQTIHRLINKRVDSQETLAARGPQVITITGAAGGVGCTTLAVNLSTTLAKSMPEE